MGEIEAMHRKRSVCKNRPKLHLYVVISQSPYLRSFSLSQTGKDTDSLVADQVLVVLDLVVDVLSTLCFYVRSSQLQAG